MRRIEEELLKASTALPEFEKSPQLPTELRIRIWTLALWTPQVIAIARLVSEYPLEFTAVNPHSPLLAVNRESRHEALKSQSLVTIRIPEFLSRKEFIFRANLDIDIFWIHGYLGYLEAIYPGMRHSLLESEYDLLSTITRTKVDSEDKSKHSKLTASGTVAVSWEACVNLFKRVEEQRNMLTSFGFDNLTVSGICEVLLIIGSNIAPNRRDIRFVPAKKIPNMTHHWKEFLSFFHLDVRSPLDAVENAINAYVNAQHAEFVVAYHDGTLGKCKPHKAFEWSTEVP